jgi:hypothetical protein
MRLVKIEGTPRVHMDLLNIEVLEFHLDTYLVLTPPRFVAFCLAHLRKLSLHVVFLVITKRHPLVI